MDSVRLAVAFRDLPPAAQVEALVRFAGELTLVGRDAYVPGTPEVAFPHRLRELNEIQHRVASHTLAILTGDARRYPDDVLLAIVLENQDPELRRQVAAALARCLFDRAA
jgi:hypothetical protein